MIKKITKNFMIILVSSGLCSSKEIGYRSDSTKKEAAESFSAIFLRTFIGKIPSIQKRYKADFMFNGKDVFKGGIIESDLGDYSEFKYFIFEKDRLGSRGYEITFETNILKTGDETIEINFKYAKFLNYVFRNEKEVSGLVIKTSNSNELSNIEIKNDSELYPIDVKILKIEEEKRATSQLIHLFHTFIGLISFILILYSNCKAENKNLIRKVGYTSSITNMIICFVIIRYTLFYSYSSILWFWLLGISCPVYSLGFENLNLKTKEFKKGTVKGVLLISSLLGFLGLIFNQAALILLVYPSFCIIVDLVDEEKDTLENHWSQILTIIFQQLLFGLVYFNKYDHRFYHYDKNTLYVYIAFCVVLGGFALALILFKKEVKKIEVKKVEEVKKNEFSKPREKKIVRKERAKDTNSMDSSDVGSEFYKSCYEKVTILPPRVFPDLRFDRAETRRSHGNREYEFEKKINN